MYGGVGGTSLALSNQHSTLADHSQVLTETLEPQRGKDSQGRNKFGCISIFLFLLVCFCKRSLRMRVERPTPPPPSARWRAHAPRQPGRWVANPGSANLRISPSRARQTTWRTPRAPAPPFLQPFLQIPNPPPWSREGAYVAPRSRSAPSPPSGLPRSLTPPAPPQLCGGAENTPRLGQPGPKLSRGEKVTPEEGGHKRIFFSFLKGHCRFKSFFPGPPLSGSPYFGGAYLIWATHLSSSLQKNQSLGVSPPAVNPPAASPAPLSSCNPRTGCKSLQHFWGAEGGGEGGSPGSGRRCRLARGPGPRAPGARSRPAPAPLPGSRRPLLSPSRSLLPLLVLE